MSEFFSPYDADRPLMLKCSCGRDHSVTDHHAEVAADAAAIELRQRSLTSEFEVYRGTCRIQKLTQPETASVPNFWALLGF